MENSYQNDSIAGLEYDMFHEIEYHLLNDKNPSYYLMNLTKEKFFHQLPFSMLNNLKDTKQSPKYHPEGSAWNHTLLVVDEAASVKHKSKNEKVFMWAALLHDIGKPDTTMYQKGRITAYNHDVVGAKLAKVFLDYFGCEKDFTDAVVKLIRWHMHILYVLKDLPFSKVEEMKKEVDIQELALLGLCDRLGRLNPDREAEEEGIRLFLYKCTKQEV